MQLKTVSSLGLAFLLVVGVVGVASAQVEVAATQGIYIRVDAPKANDWAAIGDSIIVRVLCYDGRLDAGFRVAVVDSGVADGDIESDSDLADKVYYNITDDGTGSAPEVTKGDGEESGIDTFRVRIIIAANTVPAENMESVSKHALKIVVDPDGTPDPDPLNNLMRDKKIAPVIAGFGATRVGDGVLFGLDAERPIHGTVFKSIDLDLDRLNTVLVDTSANGLSGTDQKPYIRKIHIVTDKVFRAVMNLDTDAIFRAKAVRIEVGLVPADSIARYMLRTDADPVPGLGLEEEPANALAFKDDARLKIELRGDRLYSPNPSIDMKIEAGQFNDNERLELFAYLVDGAGNVGGSSSAPEAANWKTLHGTADKLLRDLTNLTRRSGRDGNDSRTDYRRRDRAQGDGPVSESGQSRGRIARSSDHGRNHADVCQWQLHVVAGRELGRADQTGVESAQNQTQRSAE